MPGPDDQDRKNVIERFRGALFMLAFGLCILSYLVAIDRPEWFSLRPATGTAAAMAGASSNNAGQAARPLLNGSLNR